MSTWYPPTAGSGGFLLQNPPFAAMDDTLLNRCVQAWADEHCTVPMTVERRQLCARGVRAVLEHLAAELLVQHQRNPGRMSAHEAARWIRAELEVGQ